MQAEIVLYPGFDELDAIAPYEALNLAARNGADVQVRLVTLDGEEEVKAAHGLRVRPDGKLGSHPDLLIVPGGGWNSRSPQGAWAEAQRGALPAAIARLHAAGTTVASVCTGGMLLAGAGLLDGKPAVTHRGAIADLQAMGAQIVEARVVDCGDVLTAGGVTSGLDLALWLVERYFGSHIALVVEQTLEYERRGVVWRDSPAAL